MNNLNPSRRRFILQSGKLVAAGAAASVTGPFLFSAEKGSPNERARFGAIGVGGRGTSDANAARRFADIVAVCDLDKQRTDRVIKALSQGKADGYKDYRKLLDRKDIDFVTIGTTDHWHTRVAIHALRAGKDVYCEKPMTHFFAEGVAVHKTVAEKKRIFQVGSQQRSGGNFRQAVEIVRNGLIGKVTHVEVGLPGGRTGPDRDPTLKDAPEGYDRWCGPSPVLPYMEARHHWSWRWHTNYGRGQLMDWIGHHNDIAHWGLGLEATGGGGGPISVEAKNWDFSKTPDIYDTAWQYDVISKYPGDIEVKMSSRVRMGTKWIGTDGWVYVDRGRLDASNKEWIKGGFNSGKFKAYSSPGHQRNFIDSVKSRKETVAPAENAHRSVTPGHIAYVSHEIGRAIKWDPKKEVVIGDDKAQKILNALPYRGDWKI